MRRPRDGVPKTAVSREDFLLHSDGLRLSASVTLPGSGQGPFPCVQIHHGGGGFDPSYSRMARWLAERGFVGVTLIHRGYPGSEGRMEYGKGEVGDIGKLTEELGRRSIIDPARLGILGYSRGAHSALLALERFSCFKAGVLWSPPTDMVDLVRVNPWITEIVGSSPEEAPEEYRLRSPLFFTERLGCPLLVFHGDEDDVVPVRHSVRLAEALEETGRTCELRLAPGEGHSWSPGGFLQNWRETVEFFERHLAPDAPRG